MSTFAYSSILRSLFLTLIVSIGAKSAAQDEKDILEKSVQFESKRIHSVDLVLLDHLDRPNLLSPAKTMAVASDEEAVYIFQAAKPDDSSAVHALHRVVDGDIVQSVALETDFDDNRRRRLGIRANLRLTQDRGDAEPLIELKRQTIEHYKIDRFTRASFELVSSRQAEMPPERANLGVIDMPPRQVAVSRREPTTSDGCTFDLSPLDDDLVPTARVSLRIDAELTLPSGKSIPEKLEQSYFSTPVAANSISDNCVLLTGYHGCVVGRDAFGSGASHGFVTKLDGDLKQEKTILLEGRYLLSPNPTVQLDDHLYVVSTPDQFGTAVSKGAYDIHLARFDKDLNLIWDRRIYEGNNLGLGTATVMVTGDPDRPLLLAGMVKSLDQRTVRLHWLMDDGSIESQTDIQFPGTVALRPVHSAAHEGTATIVFQLMSPSKKKTALTVIRTRRFEHGKLSALKRE